MSSKIVDEDFDNSLLRKLVQKKTFLESVAEGEAEGVWVNCPLFETFLILENPSSQEVHLLKYDQLLPFRKVISHPLLRPKTFSSLRVTESPSRKVSSFLVFFDPSKISKKIDQFLDQVGLRKSDIGRRIIQDNPFGVKKVLHFDERFVCIFRDSFEGEKQSSQLVHVVDLDTQKLVFQEESTKTHKITHVEVFKIAKTNETQLFVGTVNKCHEGHSRAEWKIYRVIQRKAPDNQ